MKKHATLALFAAMLFTGAASAAGHEDTPPAKPAAQAKQHEGMAGMDHGKMEGMDHSKMEGKDHAAKDAMSFAKLDANKDGFVTKAELPKAMHAHLPMMDANKDGKISEAEFASMHSK